MSDYPTSGAKNTSHTATNTSAPLLAIYWLIVLIPLGWGVYQTVQKSIPLFHVTSTAAATSPIRATKVPPPAAPTPTDSSVAPVQTPTSTP